MNVAIVGTNVVVAGLISGPSTTPPVRILDGMLRGAFPYLLSVDLLAEYRAVLLRPRIVERHGLEADEIDTILAEIAANALVREPTGSDPAPDTGDQHLWDLHGMEPTAILVTGDQRLLDNAGNRAVLDPATFLRSKPESFPG